MGLKIILKPNERMIIGGAVVRNAGSKSELIIENNVPLLREKDIMKEEEADTPCKRIYFIIQLMYIDSENIKGHHEIYWGLVRDVVQAAPSTIGIIDRISEHILGNRYYQALKACQELIEYEEEVTRDVRSTACSI